MPRDLQTEIVGVALVGAIAGVVGAGEIFFVDVLPGDVVHRRIIGLQQHQRSCGRGHLNTVKLHQEAAWLFCNGDDRTGTGAFHHSLLIMGSCIAVARGLVGTPPQDLPP
ncbi:hypothetical protein D3C86_1705250 [compost metagenome]